MQYILSVRTDKQSKETKIFIQNAAENMSEKEYKRK